MPGFVLYRSGTGSKCCLRNTENHVTATQLSAASSLVVQLESGAEIGEDTQGGCERIGATKLSHEGTAMPLAIDGRRCLSRSCTMCKPIEAVSKVMCNPFLRSDL